MSQYTNWNDNGYNVEDVDNENEAVNQDMIIVPNKTWVKPKRKSNFNNYIALVLVTSFISSTAVGGALYSKFSSDLEKQAALIEKAAVMSTISNMNSNSADKTKVVETTLTKGSAVTEIAKKVGPSVVGIRMTFANPQSSFFGEELGQSKAEGSGVIISDEGYIMTNYHVVEFADPKNGASKNTVLEVFLPDSRQTTAKFIGGDSKNDLAVIKIDLNNLPVAELGDSSQLEVGEQAVAIGNPLGMEFAGSVTVGVISALNRKVETEDKTLNLIQTDAAINPGNSGGALVNSQGQVIGINTIKISVTGVEGLGFAIPMNDAKPIIDQLIMFGYIKGRPLIGISGREVTETIAEQYDLPVGIYIVDVTPGSGADKAGIKKDDILVSLAGKEVITMKGLNEIKEGFKAGDTVDAVVVRESGKVSLKLTFSEER